MATKQCSTCKQEKELQEFHKDKTRPDGYKSKCKQCTTIMNKQKYYKDYHKQYNENHQNERQAYRTNYNANNKQNIAYKNAERYQLNKDTPEYKAKKQEQNRLYYEQHKAKQVETN